MVKKVILIFAFLIGLVAVALYNLSLPLLRRLPKPTWVSTGGITTIDDAISACRKSGLQGWDLVEYARHLVSRKMVYSRLNTWDSYSRAFERGRGYCEQQALSLNAIYQKLGIESRVVFAMRCKFPPQIIDGFPWSGGVSGHSWVRVRIGSEELDICPGSTENKPGKINFEILSKVHTLRPWLRPITHFGSSVENIRRDTLARHSSFISVNKKLQPVLV
ncbi:MAG TPA: transglutaminase family protein [Chloroflexia bacterium]|nr:transglutaminase family protein [Chloroflexia bacterium]